MGRAEERQDIKNMFKFSFRISSDLHGRKKRENT